MHYFKRNIGDYHKKAGRLSMLEHGAYTLLMDACYDRERFPTEEEAIDWCWARTDQEVAAVKFVLCKFFTLTDGRYVQDRIVEEIEAFQSKALKNKSIAIQREAKKKQKEEPSVNEPCTGEHEPCTSGHLTKNQEPRTKNQEPIDKTIPDAYASSSTPRGDDTPKSDPIPFERIKSLYHEILPELRAVKVMNSSRKASVRQRHLGVFAKSIDAWEAYFRAVRRSSFLMGKVDGNPWRADFDFLIRESSVTKVLEGKYHEQHRGNFESSRPRTTTAAERIAAKRQQLAAQSPDVGTVATHDADVRDSVDNTAGRGTQRYLAAGVG